MIIDQIVPVMMVMMGWWAGDIDARCPLHCPLSTTRGMSTLVGDLFRTVSRLPPPLLVWLRTGDYLMLRRRSEIKKVTLKSKLIKNEAVYIGIEIYFYQDYRKCQHLDILFLRWTLSSDSSQNCKIPRKLSEWLYLLKLAKIKITTIFSH